MAETATASPNPAEAWKGVIDFAKTVLSIASALLAAFASLFAIGEHELGTLSWIAPTCFVASIVCSLFGFGRAIQALRTGITRKAALAYCNASVGLLLLGVVVTPATLRPRDRGATIDAILANVETASTQWHRQLAADKCREFRRVGQEVSLVYDDGVTVTEVTYSLSRRGVVRIGPRSISSEE